jgi:cytoskeletal protein RodZ
VSYPSNPGPPVAPQSSPTAPAGPSHTPRSGAHRPSRPLWQDLLPIIVVVVAVIALVIAVFQIQGSLFGSSSGTSSTVSDPGADDPGQGNAPTAPTSTTKTTKGTASPTTSKTSPSSPTTTSSPVDHGVSIKVYNSTSRTGLAKGAAGKLVSAGWSHAGSGGNKTFSGNTTVFYPSSSQAATAKAIAKSLGGYAVQQSSAYGSSSITVILSGDFQS